MKILIFTEGTCLTHQAGKDSSREERVRQSKAAGVQREESSLAYESGVLPKVEPGSVYDFSSYVPIGKAVAKLNSWRGQGAEIWYLTSRRLKPEIEIIAGRLQEFQFPDSANLLFRKQGQDYKDVAQELKPDVLIEDDCESIGGEVEMVYPHVQPVLKEKIHSAVVKEFAGIDDLPDLISGL